MKTVLTIYLIIVGVIIMLGFIIPLRAQLSDCQFECKNLQTEVYMLREFSDYVEILEQLPPLVVAELKVAKKELPYTWREYRRKINDQ